VTPSDRLEGGVFGRAAQQLGRDRPLERRGIWVSRGGYFPPESEGFLILESKGASKKGIKKHTPAPSEDTQKVRPKEGMSQRNIPL